MAIATIEIEVEERAAQVYNSASPDAQEKLRALLSVWLLEFAEVKPDLGLLMDQISDSAAAQGLTPNILDSLLNDE
jgi:hypothetical protein